MEQRRKSTDLFGELSVDGNTEISADLTIQGATNLYTTASKDVAIMCSIGVFFLESISR